MSGRTYEKFEQARIAAVEDAKANPLRDVGPPTKEEKNNLGNSNNTVGNTNEYLLRRLARDAPEVLDKVQSGELTVNQAAIQAGSTSTQKNRHLR